MNYELEAKYLGINKEELRSKLSSAGAECVSKERLMQRVVFENDCLNNKRAWLRVRNEGEIVTMTLKQALDAQDIYKTKELEIIVSDFTSTVTILNMLGLEQKRYQENYRESWKLGNVSIEIDSWPLIPPYIEIEADSEEEVRGASKKLGFDYNDAVFGSADEVFKKYYNIDILILDKLVFDK
ncbi:MAG: CYTH domain-containing protein [Patescibacteria group bacterium]